jgi:ATP-dependent exoDNAse (exonuclease V) alpha subunit
MITLYFKRLKELEDSSSDSSTASTASTESIETKIQRGNIKLTRDQTIALQELLDFITNPKRKAEQFYLLTGSAGTGKTFLVSYIYSVLKSNYNIAFTASTNKAANVLQATYESQYTNDSAGDKRQTSVNFYTVHRFMNSSRGIDKNGEAYFKFAEGKKGNKTADVVFVDEVSMIPEVLAGQIEGLKKYKKIIFIGDRAQLPPVNETESKIFSWRIKQSNLVEIVRYRNNIVKLADQLKNLIFHKKNISLKSCAGDGVSLYRNNDEFLKAYYSDIENTVVLAYTNERVRMYNDTIRRHVLRLSTGNKFEVGEKIMFNNFYVAQSVDGGETSINCYTSYQIKIKSCEERTYPINYDIIVETLRASLVNIGRDPAVLKPFIAKLPNNIPIYYLVTEGDFGIVNPVNYKKLTEQLDGLKEEFIKIKEEFGDLVIREFWAFYYEELVDKFADITYGYSMTVHKSQGSTYGRVFVDMEDIIKRNPKERESYQCLYTAITRASKEIHVYF